MTRAKKTALLALAACVLLVAGWQAYRVFSVPTALPASGNPVAALGLMLIEDADGLFVLAVTDNSPASSAGIRAGDHITMADGMPLESISQLETLVDDRQEAYPMPLTVRRMNENKDIYLRWRE